MAGPLPGPVGALPAEGQQVFGGVYVRDQLTGFLDLLFMAIALLTILFAPDYLRAARPAHGGVQRHAPVRHQRRDAAGAAHATC